MLTGYRENLPQRCLDAMREMAEGVAERHGCASSRELLNDSRALADLEARAAEFGRLCNMDGFAVPETVPGMLDGCEG